MIPQNIASPRVLLTGNFLWKISSVFSMLRFRSSRLSRVALIVGVYQSLEWSNVLSKRRKLRLNWRGCSAWLTVYLFSSISQQTVFFLFSAYSSLRRREAFLDDGKKKNCSIARVSLPKAAAYKYLDFIYTSQIFLCRVVPYIKPILVTPFNGTLSHVLNNCDFIDSSKSTFAVFQAVHWLFTAQGAKRR